MKFHLAVWIDPTTDVPPRDHSDTPAQNCFNARANQVAPDEGDCGLVEPIPGVPDENYGAANFNCDNTPIPS
jgi:hypothetical protein